MFCLLILLIFKYLTVLSCTKMLFIPLDNGENLNWKDEDGYWYSSVFAVYERKSIQNLNWIIKKFSKVAYIKRSDNYVPAFVFDVLK